MTEEQEKLVTSEVSEVDDTNEISEEFATWEFPYVGEDTQQRAPDVTNAMNRRSDWKYEPPEEEEEILPPTAEEIEAIRAAAHAEGFEAGQKEGKEQGYEQGLAEGTEAGLAQGLEEGTAQGIATGEQQAQENMAAWQGLLDSLQNPVNKVEQELEQELVLLAVSLAKSVIRSEVKTNSDMIFQALREGLKALPIQEKFYQVHLNPADIELINNHFSAEEIAKHNWQLIESAEMSAGGCEIITQSNAVDVTVERRVKDILDKFLLEQGLSHVSSSDS
ncbi:flagellar assembly protein FliH [Paraglaciecola aquimarina]|uniref:Flagellar assembly protein FliH n=1 Tax=Paraglaciecola algarum TaxID=3050085 RepID=A0ABS9DF34_9ALTE|nr:flagellar assembly protein FliH [Paraglaciecola sp. G1-23]MCF2950216.1 flagellar assembly protein FliH [Paraglaciecola sp. G1-23]